MFQFALVTNSHSIDPIQKVELKMGVDALCKRELICETIGYVCVHVYVCIYICACILGCVCVCAYTYVISMARPSVRKEESHVSGICTVFAHTNPIVWDPPMQKFWIIDLFAGSKRNTGQCQHLGLCTLVCW